MSRSFRGFSLSGDTCLPQQSLLPDGTVDEIANFWFLTMVQPYLQQCRPWRLFSFFQVPADGWGSEVVGAGTEPKPEVDVVKAAQSSLSQGESGTSMFRASENLDFSFSNAQIDDRTPAWLGRSGSTEPDEVLTHRSAK